MATSNIVTSNILTFAGQFVRAVCYTSFDKADVLLESGELLEGQSMPPYGVEANVGGCVEVRKARERAGSHQNSLPEDSTIRNSYPMADGLIDYFPNALAEVSRISYIGNQKHNPGESMHWARGKSTDHRNKMARHLVDVGGSEETEVDGKKVRVRHSAYLAWRALANLQIELEREEGYPMSRGSRP